MQISDRIKAAKRAAVPIVSIDTADPANTLRMVAKAVNAKDTTAFLQWDVSRALQGMNELGDKVLADLAQGEDPKFAFRDPGTMLSALTKAPERTIVFMHNAQKFIDQPEVAQGIWNLRDMFKTKFSMLVLLGPGIKLPDDLTQDVVCFSEELPNRAEISGIIKDVVESAKTQLPELVVGDDTKICDTLTGLSAFACEQQLAMSITKTGVDLEELWLRKRKQVEQTDGISVERPALKLKDMIGCSQIVKFGNQLMRGEDPPTSLWLIDEIEKSMAGAKGDMSGTSQDQLMVLLTMMQDYGITGWIEIGPPGCLSGDTVLSYQRGKRNSSRPITLRRLYQKFNGLPATGIRSQKKPWKLPTDTMLQSYCHTTGKVEYNRVVSVMASGWKECLRLEASSGDALILTPDHPVLTPDGFVLAQDLKCGDELICRATMKPKKVKHKAPRAERVVVSALKYYPSGMDGSVTEPSSGKVYHYKKQTRARLVLEAAINGMSYEEFVEMLKSDPAGLNVATIPNSLEIHHANGNSMDDRIENLVILTKPEHTTLHDPVRRFNCDYTTIETVVSITPCGQHEVFDIQMESPNNNFCTSGGLFVHNSAKTYFPQCLSGEYDIPFGRVDLGAMKDSLVGGSERKIRSAMKIIRAISDNRGMFVATCNSITALPPELRRRFTLGTWMFMLPDESELKPMWKYYIKKMGLKDGQVNKVDDKGWTGAEVKACCDVARRARIKLSEAAAYIVPVSKAASETIETLYTLAHQRFLCASYEGLFKNPKQTTEKDRRLEL